VRALGNRLGRGEAEARAIALEREADLVCLDDHAARAEAMRLGLEVKGTLGILRRLMELEKFRCDTEALLQNLKRMDFRVKDKIFRDIHQTS
jgi:predicted nucleic acid-binding protein